jgi:SAM-dependent methyltransferase
MNASHRLSALKTRQQAAWGTGDYAVIGTTLQIVGESLAEACDLKTDERVLDVAAGNGNATLAAARRGCLVTSTDYVGEPARARRRARARGTPRRRRSRRRRRSAALRRRQLRRRAVDLRRDVRARPSTLGRRTGARVRPGGRIGLANWTPDSLIGRMFKVLGRYVPPPAGVQAPSLWGTEAHLRTLFGRHRCGRARRPAHFVFRYRSAAHFIDVFRTWYGPVNKAFAAQTAEKAEALAGELAELLNSLNRAGAGLAGRAERVPRSRRHAGMSGRWMPACNAASSATAGTGPSTPTRATGTALGGPARRDC